MEKVCLDATRSFLLPSDLVRLVHTALRAEVKALKDANKALTLYCSKILDRIMSIDGFEEVLSSGSLSLPSRVPRAVFDSA